MTKRITIPVSTDIESAKKQDGWVLREVLFDDGEPIAHREPAQRQPLTDEQIMQTWEGIIKYAPGEVRLRDFARAIEAAHGIKEKNHG